MSHPTFDSSVDHYRRILGVLFYVGPIEGLLERTMRGGLIVVPSAPVLVNLPVDPVHRQAIETSDLAVTDSGFMVLLWRLFTREKIIRISGLRYIRALMDDPRFRDSKSIFWIMPSKRDEIGNRAWLMEQGMTVEEDDCYLAPMYAREGPLVDPALLAKIEARRPQFVMINLGGGVQERLGLYLRDALVAKQVAGSPEVGESEPQVSGLLPQLPPGHPLQSASGHGAAMPSSPLGSVRSQASAPSVPYRPALICTGAAIAFLSNRQVNIPPWADRLFLGWLMRSLSEPTKFIPRYWHSLRLAVLMWRFGSRSVAAENVQS
jgi:UDP-N-acetyl-D-mannosaminuronic acid transferase (WecB/TagA/CpsF family)